MPWATETLGKVLRKYRNTAPLAEKLATVPYVGKGGEWLDSGRSGNGWWTNGFWPAIMWQGYALTEDEFFIGEARRVQEKILKEMHGYYNTSHDLGFMYLISCGADYKLTGDKDALRETLLAANLLAGRFNPAGKFIRSWNQPGREGWVIVDCMMNLPLLYSATRLTNDPRYAAVARVHADTTNLNIVREDGSCFHIVTFDPYTGKKLSTPAGQGSHDGSSWSRGQAWALYGFTLSYLHTRDPKYLYTARRIADYFLSQVSPDGLTRVDFQQPEDVDMVDNIAAAIAACGLIELSRETGNDVYMEGAVRLLKAMDELSANYDENTCGVLQRCTAAYSASYSRPELERETNIIYGDYFYMEALAKLTQQDPMLWSVG